LSDDKKAVFENKLEDPTKLCHSKEFGFKSKRLREINEKHQEQKHIRLIGIEY
jgi:hypothetical protein